MNTFDSLADQFRTHDEAVWEVQRLMERVQKLKLAQENNKATFRRLRQENRRLRVEAQELRDAEAPRKEQA